MCCAGRRASGRRCSTSSTSPAGACRVLEQQGRPSALLRAPAEPGCDAAVARQRQRRPAACASCACAGSGAAYKRACCACGCRASDPRCIEQRAAKAQPGAAGRLAGGHRKLRCLECTVVRRCWLADCPHVVRSQLLLAVFLLYSTFLLFQGYLRTRPCCLVHVGEALSLRSQSDVSVPAFSAWLLRDSAYTCFARSKRARQLCQRALHACPPLLLTSAMCTLSAM
jgi:hypothetical protein